MVVEKKSKGYAVFMSFDYLIMGAFALSIILPMLYILQLSFSDFATLEFRLIPKKFTLNNYKFIIENATIIRPFINSVVITIAGTLLSVFFTVMMAYPLSRKDLVFRKFFNYFVLFTMMFSIGFIPEYLVIMSLHLVGSYSAIFLTHLIGTFELILLRNFISSIPDEIIESSRIDGCSEMRILFKIVFPLAIPGIATITLFYIVNYWNMYFPVVLYINDSKKYTLQVILRELVIEEEDMIIGTAQQGTPVNMKYTTIIASMLPILAVYPFLQKYFTKGLLVGSLKG